jgi:hypothetical protein
MSGVKLREKLDNGIPVVGKGALVVRFGLVEETGSDV